MPHKRSKNEQITFALRQAENGARLDEVYQKMSVSEPTVYRWKKQFVGMGVQAPAHRCQRRGNRYNWAKVYLSPGVVEDSWISDLGGAEGGRLISNR